MMNLISSFISRTRMRGALVLAISLALLASATLIVLIAANSGSISSKVFGAQYRSAQAFMAAQAGLDFGEAYLKANRSSIIQDSNLDGYIDSYTSIQTQNVSLPNGSVFSVNFSNPIVNDFDLIEIIVTGTSEDGTATRFVSQQIKFMPVLFHYEQLPLVILGDVSMSGSAKVRNTEGSATIRSGDDIRLYSGAKTINSSGIMSTSSGLSTDVVEEDGVLEDMEQDLFFENHFGVQSSFLKLFTDLYYQNYFITSYDSELDGQQGKFIWIDQTFGSAVLAGNTEIGSSSDPVVLVIDGNLSVSGGVEIYGFVYVSGNVYASGTATINGGIIVGGNLYGSGNMDIIYDSTALQNTQSNLLVIGKVPGSWRDW